MARQISDEGLALLKQFEGLRLTAYQDVGGVWTIGYGHTAGVNEGDTCTEAQAEQWLREDLGGAERTIETIVSVPLNDNQFSALVSLTYNIGNSAFKKSSLLKKLNAGGYNAVPGELMRWTKVNGKTVHGLVNRRAAEAGLWAKGSFVASNYVEPSGVKQGMATPQAAGAAGATGLGLIALGSQLIDQLQPYASIKWVGIAVTALIVATAIGGTIYAARKG